MIDLIKNIVEALVDNPDQVEVKAVEGEHTLILEVSVAKEDIGKIIGKQGRTARAIRTIRPARLARQKNALPLKLLNNSIFIAHN